MKSHAGVQRDRVEQLKDIWVSRLGLKWWVRVEFIYEIRRDIFKTDTVQIESAMMTLVDWTRQWAEISVNLPLVSFLNDEELEHVLLHELCHVLVSPMAGDSCDLEDFVVTKLAQAFAWTEEMVTTDLVTADLTSMT